MNFLVVPYAEGGLDKIGCGHPYPPTQLPTRAPRHPPKPAPKPTPLTFPPTSTRARGYSRQAFGAMLSLSIMMQLLVVISGVRTNIVLQHMEGARCADMPLAYTDIRPYMRGESVGSLCGWRTS